MREHSLTRFLYHLPLLLLACLLGCGGDLPGQEATDPAVRAQSAPAAPMVRLVYADVTNYGCSSCVLARGYVELRNLHPTKQLTAVYSADGSPFIEIAGSFVGMIDADREIWSFEIPAPGQSRFALRYRAGGNEYWDNNDGHDYVVNGPGLVPALGVGRDVALVDAQVASLDAGEVDLYMVLRDRAFHKEVAAVYSADGWATSQVAQAHYVGSYGDGMQRWQVSAPFRKDAGQVSLAIVARQAGGEQWDNQYGKNFSCVRCQSRSCQRWICQGLTLPRR